MTATSTIAINDEVRDQRQRVQLLRRRERREVGLRSPGVLLRPRKRVLDARVVHDAPPDLVDLVRVEYALARAQEYAGAAKADLAAFAPSEELDTLALIADFVVDRDR